MGHPANSTPRTSHWKSETPETPSINSAEAAGLVDFAPVIGRYRMPLSRSWTYIFSAEPILGLPDELFSFARPCHVAASDFV